MLQEAMRLRVTVAVLLGAALLGGLAGRAAAQRHPAATQVLAHVQPLPRAETHHYPLRTLFEDASRKLYTDGQLRVIVPRLELDCPVLDGTDPGTLERGPGLYDYAQLPAWGNPNVSIAGHRDVFGAPFLHLDTLGEGDRLFLATDCLVYGYTWQETVTVSPEDWTPIFCRDYSSITLTACDPIGTTLNRIAVIGRLETVESLEDWEQAQKSARANSPGTP